jgi:hypothetical protein
VGLPDAERVANYISTYFDDVPSWSCCCATKSFAFLMISKKQIREKPPWKMTNLCRLIANNPKRKIVQLSWLL